MSALNAVEIPKHSIGRVPRVPPVTPEERLKELQREFCAEHLAAQTPAAEDSQELLTDLYARLKEAGIEPEEHILQVGRGSRRREIRSSGVVPEGSMEALFDVVFAHSLLATHPRWNGEAECNVVQWDLPPYPLRRVPIIRRISKQTGAPHLCSLPEFAHLPVGSGSTITEALESLKRQVHFAFQRLIALEEYEQSESDRALWEQLVQLIDVERYETRRRIIRRVVGRVVKLPADAGVPEASSGDRDWRVSWDPDEREEGISMDQVPPEFARLRPGQWFEAVVHMKPDARATRRILHAQVRRPPARMGDEEAKCHALGRRYQGKPEKS